MTTWLRLVIVVSLVACAACEGGEDEGTAGADARPPGIDAAAADLLLTCNAGDSTFPVFSRDCQDAADCAIANHQTDCCGSSIATGIAATDLAAFQQSEGACAALFPDCACASQPPLLDDGTSAINFQTIDVGCSNEGSCWTFNVELPGN
jgi:hypothetical protein